MFFLNLVNLHFTDLFLVKDVFGNQEKVLEPPPSQQNRNISCPCPNLPLEIEVFKQRGTM